MGGGPISRKKGLRNTWMNTGGNWTAPPVLAVSCNCGALSPVPVSYESVPGLGLGTGLSGTDRYDYKTNYRKPPQTTARIWDDRQWKHWQANHRVPPRVPVKIMPFLFCVMWVSTQNDWLRFPMYICSDLCILNPFSDILLHSKAQNPIILPAMHQ